MEQLLSLLGVKNLALLIAGFLGSVLSLKFVADAKTWPQRGFMVLGGTVFAAYVTPVLGNLMGASEPMERGLSFMVGLFGLTLASAIFNGIRETKFGEVIAGWFKRPGS